MLKIKTLITYLCSLILSDSEAVEIFTIGQPCAKIFRKVRYATFLRHGVLTFDCRVELHTHTICGYS